MSRRALCVLWVVVGVSVVTMTAAPAEQSGDGASVAPPQSGCVATSPLLMAAAHWAGSSCHLDAVVADPASGVDVGVDVGPTRSSAVPTLVAGAVSGTVTEDGSGIPVAGALVVAVTEAGAVGRGAVADASGRYGLALSPGTYGLQFLDPSGRHEGEWYDDHSIADFEGAAMVTVSTGAPLVIDAGLAPAGRSGAIAGTVTTTGTGTPVGGAWVLAIRADTGATGGGTLSAADGSYRIHGLAAGSYFVAAIDPTMAHSYELFFRDKDQFATADAIPVSPGAVANVDPDLDPAAPTPRDATITGQVTDDASGDPIPGAWVAAVHANTGAFTAATEADGSGDYTLAVPAGPYKLQMLDPSGDHRSEWFDDTGLDDFGGATPVTVATAGTSVADGDLAPLTGAVAGAVTRAGSSKPVAGAWVIALRAADGAAVAFDVTDGHGQYRIAGLEPLAHLIAVVDPTGVHAPEVFYRDADSFASAQPVAIAAGSTEPVDVDLAGPPAPVVDSFSASVSDTNRITVNWATSGGAAAAPVYLYDELSPVNPALGAKAAATGSVSFRATAAGRRRFRIIVTSAAGVRTVERTSVMVPFLRAPEITSPVPMRVDQIDRTDVTITWQHQAGGFARVTRPNGSTRDVAGTASGATVTGSYLVTEASLVSGANAYRVAFCKTTADPASPLCSEGAMADVDVGPQRFTGDYREAVSPGQTITVGWTGSGNGRFFNVQSDRLALDEWSTGSSMAVTLPGDASGVYDLRLTTCATRDGASVCANLDDVTAAAAGTVATVASVGDTVFAGQQVASVTTASGPLALTAPRTGTVVAVHAAVGAAVTAGGTVVSVLVPDDVEHKQLIASTREWTERDVLSDFDSGPADRAPMWTDRPAGLPIDVAYSPDGDLWAAGEFGWALTQWSDGTLETHPAPLLVKPNAAGTLIPVSPFSYAGRPLTTWVASLAERVTFADGKIWWTQGGGFWGTPTGNHSRILSFDPERADDPSTDDDERVCVVHVPTDAAEAVGLVFDGERIWYADGGIHNAAAVNSFDPDELPCDNLLDYSDPAAVAAAVHRYCTQPSEDGCIRRIVLPGGLGPGHIAYDQRDRAIWVAEFYGAAIDRVDVDTGAVQRWPTPATHRPYGLGLWFGGAPWQIRTDADHVYFSDYWDSDLVRFHKDTGHFDELALPMEIDGAGAHSIELVGDRLWFTQGTDGPGDAATIGYVDTSDWGPGVVYTGLAALVDSDRAGLAYPGPAGIAVRDDGEVTFADYGRRQLVTLRPRG